MYVALPGLSNIVRLISQVVVPEVTFPGMCWSRLEEFPDRPALVDGISGQAVTLREAKHAARSGTRHNGATSSKFKQAYH